MSGHSHWKTIKYKKGTADAKRGKLFSKLSKMISAAVKQGRADPAFNPRLKLAIEQARSFNMPNENIERAVKRAQEGSDLASLEELMLEGFGPGNTTLLIALITDNKNRALGEIRQVLAKYGGKLGETGSVKWAFEQNGTIQISKEKHGELAAENLEMKLIDAGAKDIVHHEDTIEVLVEPQALEQTKQRLKDSGIIIESSGIDWLPKNIEALAPDAKGDFEKLINELDELEDVQDIYSNTTLD